MTRGEYWRAEEIQEAFQGINCSEDMFTFDDVDCLSRSSREQLERRLAQTDDIRSEETPKEVESLSQERKS